MRKNKINKAKAKLDSNGNGYVEFTSNNKYFQCAIECLTLLHNLLEICREIKSFCKGE